MLGVVFWAALLVGSVAIGTLAFFLFASRNRDSGGGTAGGQDATKPGWEISQPAEEGAQLDEWSGGRLDKAA